MPKPVPMSHESQEEVLGLFNTIPDRERRHRVHAVFLIKIGHCKTRKALAKTLQVERKAVERWLTQDEQAGLQSLRRIWMLFVSLRPLQSSPRLNASGSLSKSGWP